MMEVGEYYMVGPQVFRLERRVTDVGRPCWWTKNQYGSQFLYTEELLAPLARVTGFDGTPYEEPAFQGNVGEYWKMTRNPWAGAVVCLVSLDKSSADPWWWGWWGWLNDGKEAALFTFKNLKGATRVQGFSGEPYVGDVQDDGPQVPEVGSLWMYTRNLHNYPDRKPWRFAYTERDEDVTWFLFRAQSDPDSPRWMTLDEFSRHMVPYKPAAEPQTVRKPQVGDTYLAPSTGDTLTVIQSDGQTVRLNGPDSHFGHGLYGYMPSQFEKHLTEGFFVLADRSQLIRDKLAELDAKRTREQATHWDPYGGLL